MAPKGFVTKFYVDMGRNEDLSKVFDLLAADGVSGQTDKGFVVDSREYTTTAPYGPLGRADYWKHFSLSQQVFKLNAKKTLIESWISAEQFFGESGEDGGLGAGYDAYADVINNIQEDPRIASAGLIVYDEENELMYGHLLTNQNHYGFYSRTNFAQMAAVAPTMYVAPPPPPLIPGDPATALVAQLQQSLLAQGYMSQADIDSDGAGVYGPLTTAAVAQFQSYRNITSITPGWYDQTTAVALFVQANQVMTLLGLACPLDEQGLQPAFIPPAVDTSIQPLNIAGTAFTKQYGQCAGTCTKKQSRYGPKNCGRQKCGGCVQPPSSSYEQLVNLNARYAQDYRYTQPYNQLYGANYFGLQSLAPHVHFMLLGNRQSSAPLSEFVKVGIEFDQSLQAVNFYVNDSLKHSLNRPGGLLQELYRGVLQDGEIAVTPSCAVRVGFGTFSFMDVTLPSAYGTDDGNSVGFTNLLGGSTNAMVPLDDVGSYKIPYGNSAGMFDSTVLGSSLFAFYNGGPPYSTPMASDRLLGQGSALVIKDIAVSVCNGSGSALHDELEYLENGPCGGCPSSSSSSSSSCSSSSSSSKCSSSSSSSSCSSSSSSSSSDCGCPLKKKKKHSKKH